MVTIRVALLEQRDASYDVVIGRHTIADLPGLLAAACPAARYAVITDSRVAPLYADAIRGGLARGGGCVDVFVFPAGEGNKTRDTWAALADQMLAAGCGRDSAVIALGGGVVGDVAGFVAATYLRGIPYVQVPTTLLAMIDSSIGGKTGVDVPAGKNLLGAFHQPRLVVADLDVLGTLPVPDFAAGIAEAVKHGAIGDAAYFGFLERDHGLVKARAPEALERLVRDSVAIKAGVVSADEREAGRRAILNFGHTVGHAIEVTAKFAVLHGEAIAIGMAYEARLAEILGVAAPGTAGRITELLERYDLPRELPDGVTVDSLLAAMQVDKKARAGAVRFALPATIGRMHHDGGRWTVAAKEGVLREVLSARAEAHH